MTRTPGPYAPGRQRRHPLRTAMIRCGIGLTIVSGAYLGLGLLGYTPLEMVEVQWNNIRVIAGASIVGCLLAAMGYGEE